MSTRPINRRKTVRHFSESKDKSGHTRFYVTYEDLSGHAITPEELQSYRDREARGKRGARSQTGVSLPAGDRCQKTPGRGV